MRNSLIQISELWEIKRDEFYEIDPNDESINDENKYRDLFCQEDLLWIKKSDYNLDLGWYGKGIDGHFGLYLYKGLDWNNCQLLEKRSTNNYKAIIELINRFINNVDSGRYDSTMAKFASIDECSQSEVISLLDEK